MLNYVEINMLNYVELMRFFVCFQQHVGIQSSKPAIFLVNGGVEHPQRLENDEHG